MPARAKPGATTLGHVLRRRHRQLLVARRCRVEPDLAVERHHHARAGPAQRGDARRARRRERARCPRAARPTGAARTPRRRCRSSSGGSASIAACTNRRFGRPPFAGLRAAVAASSPIGSASASSPITRRSGIGRREVVREAAVAGADVDRRRRVAARAARRTPPASSTTVRALADDPGDRHRPSGARDRARARARTPRCDRCRASLAAPARASTPAHPARAASAAARRRRRRPPRRRPGVGTGVDRRRDHERALAERASRPPARSASAATSPWRNSSNVFVTSRPMQTRHSGTHRGDVGQRLGDTRRRLVAARPRIPSAVSSRTACWRCGRAPGQEAAEHEPVDRKARRGQHRERGRRPGNRAHRDALGDRPAHDDVAGIAAQRRARVAHERDARAAPQSLEHALDPLGLVVIVVARRRARRRCRSAARARGADACPRRARDRRAPTPRSRARPMSSSFPIGSDTTKSAPAAGSASDRADRHVQLALRGPRAARPAPDRASAAVFDASNATVRPRRPAPRRNTSDESPRKNGLIVAVNESRDAVALQRDLDLAAQARAARGRRARSRRRARRSRAGRSRRRG